MNNAIYQAIKRRILYLAYAPGQILNENTLAGEFGVSRTPMREVLYRLAWEQLARIIPRTGTTVTLIDFQTMMHTYQARLGITGEVGRLYAELDSDDHLAALERIHTDGKVLAAEKIPTLRLTSTAACARSSTRPPATRYSGLFPIRRTP